MATGASNCRSRGHPGRRAQGRADADPAPRLHLLAARHPPRRAGGQQDRPGRLRPGRCSTRSSRDYRRLRRPASASTRSSPIPMSARYGDNVIEPRRQHALVSRARRCSSIWKPSTSTSDAADEAVPLPGAVGQPAEPRFPRLLPARSPRGAIAAGDAVVVAASGQDLARSTRIVTDGRRPAPRPRPATPSR